MDKESKIGMFIFTLICLSIYVMFIPIGILVKFLGDINRGRKKNNHRGEEPD